MPVQAEQITRLFAKLLFNFENVWEYAAMGVANQISTPGATLVACQGQPSVCRGWCPPWSPSNSRRARGGEGAHLSTEAEEAVDGLLFFFERRQRVRETYVVSWKERKTHGWCKKQEWITTLPPAFGHHPKGMGPPPPHSL